MSQFQIETTTKYKTNNSNEKQNEVFHKKKLSLYAKWRSFKIVTQVIHQQLQLMIDATLSTSSFSRL